MSEAESAHRLQELLSRLDAELAALEKTDASEDAVDRLTQMADLAREVQGEIDRLRREDRDASS